MIYIINLATSIVIRHEKLPSTKITEFIYSNALEIIMEIKCL